MKKIITFLLCMMLVFVVGCSDTYKSQNQYKLGIKNFNEGNYAEAIVSFTSAIEFDENNLDSYIGRAEAYFESGDMENVSYAISDYEKAIEIDAASIEAYRGLVDIYISLGDYTKALEILSDAENKISDKDSLYDNKTVYVYSVEDKKEVYLKDLTTYLENSWYTEPVTIMYAADGRTMVIYTSKIEAYKSADWYTEPVTIMYAADGRTMVIYTSEIEAYKSAGWYTEPVTIMYAADGRTMVIHTSEVEAYKGVGWYTEPVTIMYAADGRTMVIHTSEVEAYKSVGWYTEPVKIVLKSQPKIYLKSSASDSDFLSFANENYATLSMISMAVNCGLYFNWNDDGYIFDYNAPNYEGWFLVDDDRVSTIKEIEEFWHSYFSKSSNKSYKDVYKEIDGRLYTARMIMGFEGEECKRKFTKVNRIRNNCVEIKGVEDVYEYDLFDETEYYSYSNNISITMVLEDGIWMCESLK